MSNSKATTVKHSTSNKSRIFDAYGFLLLAFILIAFFPVFQNVFVNWGDPIKFFQNTWVTNPDGLNIFNQIIGIFANSNEGAYHPLTTISYMIDYRLFGFTQTAGWHSMNLVFHMLSSILVYRLFVKVGLANFPAFFIALLFSVHPMMVESVAWISQREDALFTVFYLLAIIKYMDLTKNKNPKAKLWLYLFFILSCFSSIQAITLPLSLLAFDFLSRKKWSFADFSSKWLLFLIAIIWAGLTWYINAGQGPVVDQMAESSVLDHILLGVHAFGVYMYKSIAPYPISAYYPIPESYGILFYGTLIALPALLYFMIWSYLKKKHIVFFGLFFFFVHILWGLQFMWNDASFLADHVSYPAYIGLISIPILLFQKSLVSFKRSPLWLSIPFIIAIVFAAMSHKETRHWKNGENLWNNVITHYPDDAKAFYKLGEYHYNLKNFTRAIEAYNSLLSIEDDFEINAQRAKAFLRLNNNVEFADQALTDLSKAIYGGLETAENYVNMGYTYFLLGNYENSIKGYTAAIEKNPRYVVAYISRANIYKATGEYQKALDDLNMVTRLGQGSAQVQRDMDEIKSKMESPNEGLIFQ